jgi:hypothetical protein
MWGLTEVGAVAPVAAVLTLGEGFAILNVVVVGAAP